MFCLKSKIKLILDILYKIYIYVCVCVCIVIFSIQFYNVNLFLSNGLYKLLFKIKQCYTNYNTLDLNIEYCTT